MRTLSERALNRALLARQLLLEPADLPLPRAIERVGGLQSQYAPSAYIGAWSRLRAFERPDLTHALERGMLVQATLMRATIHIVSRRDFWPIAIALRRPRRAWWLRVTRQAVEPSTMATAARRLRAVLREGPRRRSEIVAALGADAQAWNGLGLWLDLVRVPPSGTWEHRRADLYALAEQVIGPPPAGTTEASGRELLVRRYLAAFGPASPSDVSSFTGLPRSLLAPVVDGLAVRRFRDERGDELLDVPRGPIPDERTPAPVRFLPTWDATLLVHARRTQIVPERVRPVIFNTKTPHSMATFLVDGQVAGAWRLDEARVRVSAFGDMTTRAWRAVRDEAERLEAFLA